MRSHREKPRASPPKGLRASRRRGSPAQGLHPGAKLPIEGLGQGVAAFVHVLAPLVEPVAQASEKTLGSQILQMLVAGVQPVEHGAPHPLPLLEDSPQQVPAFLRHDLRRGGRGGSAMVSDVVGDAVIDFVAHRGDDRQG